MNCICCGKPVAWNISNYRCVMCEEQKMRWESANAWLPLARLRIDVLEKEVSELIRYKSR